ncbi:hypothetical protein [Bacillus sp. FJAT-45350]|uniref:hypothetical protein n=1 Tax=Bacillus sp. FJAT-45350 TaxID=2011014 RepID=UPI0015CBDBCE|nr:hypothetical protein [Bacillus sp. FJAT-45350]
MPHHKRRGKPVELALGENEVSKEFAEELADGGERNVAIEKQQGKSRKKESK